MKNLTTTLLLFLWVVYSYSQDYFPVNDGVKTKNTTVTVFTNATIHTDAKNIVKNGMIAIQNNKILQVGSKFALPENSVIIDLKGKHIYPSFIDLYTHFGVTLPKSKDNGNRNQEPQYDASREGYYWNDHIRPETNVLTSFNYDATKAKTYLDQGFGVLQTHFADGIARGTGMLIALSATKKNNERLLDDTSAQFFSFEKSKLSKQAYPTSLMGAMALLRQMYLDADWYAKGMADSKDLSLEALQKNNSLPQIFEAGSRINSLRADKIGDQFNIQYTLLGGGDEYERINEVKNTNATYIIPINFPEPYDATDPYLTSLLSLGDMRYWNQAPSNPGILAKNKVPFSITTYKLKKIASFKDQIKKAISNGLQPTDALAALTTVPAKLLGKENELGTLKKDAYANFLITDGELFSDKTVIYENWVLGKKHVVNPMNIVDLTGNYTLTVGTTKYNVALKGKPNAPKATVKLDTLSIKNTVSYKDNWLTLVLADTDTTSTNFTRLTTRVSSDGVFENTKAIQPTGSISKFSLVKNQETTKESKKKEEASKSIERSFTSPITYPNIAFGNTRLPQQQTLLIKNATVWTNETDRILEATDVLVKDGKIAAIGKNLRANNAVSIDGTGKHLTAGIIDEHSHIAAAAINEAGHNSSAEVTIEDVVQPDDIDIYRNLAGGVTSIQILHGSANPIGGRSAIIKLKWGETAENMIYDATPKFIKFALGENVKQSNWGSRSRFPQSRMGVEQLYMDYFSRAKNYDTKKKAGLPYRKDLEMETLAEILNGERFISCHSYVQSEINMLMKVAEKFDFRINTFTHILEGYKVANKMAEHGVGGSTFSDWWAYKFEVNDAIPYNAAIMHNEGVTVAINSDDAEMSRRLNQEAAKSVKYGGISEEDAWKFVTLNPAKLLHIDNRVGSIKVGKDADLVLWTDHPLSVYAKAEKTIIEGAVYFDLEQDKKQRAAIATEKNRLAALMIAEKNKGLKTQVAKKKEKQRLECETIETIY
ncbi:amidohydrolase family protein [Aquimarina intermedia]|uniref:Imidazolonepropionase-like amidohydrolase n=1 Tax=Aquimarina intermedia TaxID=350814 RepID=A0A5S5C4I8_9FLAO|nr:amidohydrolase family protein [Aquimarina intermedia]TYP72873.1 imidazolonepropionase-like amidohydrolase [Aquimarina intermedia]